MIDIPDRALPRFHAAAVVLLLALHLLLLVTSSWNQSQTYDEPDHLSFGLGYLKEGRLVEADAQRMPVTVLNALAFRLLTPEGTPPPRYEALATNLGDPATGPLPSPPLEGRTQRAHNLAGRLPTMLVSLLLGVAVLAWSTRLYGPTAGLLSLTLYAFCPNLIAHGRLITTDVYAAAAALAAAWAFWGLCRRPSAATFVLSALTLGLAQAAKFSSVVLVPAFGLILLLPAARAPLAAALRARPRSWAWVAFCPLLACLALGAAYRFDGLFRPFAEFPFHSYFFAWLKTLWPGLALPLPRVYLEGLDLSRYIDTHPGVIRGHNYLLGRLSDEGWWYYYLVVGLFKVPLGVLGLLGMRSVMGLVGRWRSRREAAGGAGLRAESGSGRAPAGTAWKSHLGGQPSFPDWTFLLVPALAFLAFFSLFSSVQLGFRYVLPVLPLAYVWAGGMLARACRQAENHAPAATPTPAAGSVPDSIPDFDSPPADSLSRHGKRIRCIAWSLAAAAAFSSLISFPDYIPYTNELVLPKTRAYRIMADSNLEWGQDRFYLREYLAAHPEAVANPREPAAGHLVVRVNLLVGVFQEDRFAWLRNDFEPSSRLHGSYLIYRIRPGDPKPE